jgi:MazG family protein
MAREALVAELVRLYDLTARLRLECPWDKKQSQESIVAYTLEETYELADAIRRRAEGEGDDGEVKGELGDLLFQVYFLACVAEEEGRYDLGDVAAGIHEKLVRRHPHIFGEVMARTPDEVRQNWDAIKKHSEGRVGIFHDIPEAFPAPLYAQKLQQRAAAAGFDWDQAAEVLAKIEEETAEVADELAAHAGGQRDKLAWEIGDLLFAVVNLARKVRVDPELALRGSAQRFRERVEGAAKAAERDGLVFEDLGLDAQETYYQKVKKEQER